MKKIGTCEACKELECQFNEVIKEYGKERKAQHMITDKCKCYMKKEN